MIEEMLKYIISDLDINNDNEIITILKDNDNQYTIIIIPTLERCFFNEDKHTSVTKIRSTNICLIDLRDLYQYNIIISKIINKKYLYINELYRKYVERFILNDINNIKENCFNIYKEYLAIVCNLKFPEPCSVDKIKLTNNEKIALNQIVKEVGAEGNFSVVKVMQKVDISRSVFMSLLNKLKDNRIATIESQGVKGTHIRFNNYQNIESFCNKLQL